MANRQRRREIAEETVRVLEAGHYTAPSGKVVDISFELKSAIDRTYWWDHNEWPEKPSNDRQREASNTKIEVSNETTFAAVSRLIQNPENTVGCLNFASAMNPGGGFLNGSQAQEEALARASGLVPSLERAFELYEAARYLDSKLYLDHVIMSPDVPVIRDDHDTFLENPHLVHIVSSAAPNAAALSKRGDVEGLTRLPEVFQNRINKVLDATIVSSVNCLVLGAWGCGVFGNTPKDVASWFHKALQRSEVTNHFDRIVFAVLDRPGGDAISAFEEVFEPKSN